MEPVILVNNFKDRLLASDLKDSIAKIILFGSQAKGTATIHSDIDVLVVTANGKDIEKSLMDIAFEFSIEQNLTICFVFL